MALLDDPGKRFRIREAIALDIRVPEKQDAGSGRRITGLLLSGGCPPPATPVGVLECTNQSRAVPPSQAKATLPGPPAQIRVALILGCASAPGWIQGPPVGVPRQPKHSLGAGQPDHDRQKLDNHDDRASRLLFRWSHAFLESTNQYRAEAATTAGPTSAASSASC